MVRMRATHLVAVCCDDLEFGSTRPHAEEHSCGLELRLLTLGGRDAPRRALPRVCRAAIHTARRRRIREGAFPLEATRDFLLLLATFGAAESDRTTGDEKREDSGSNRHDDDDPGAGERAVRCFDGRPRGCHCNRRGEQHMDGDRGHDQVNIEIIGNM